MRRVNLLEDLAKDLVYTVRLLRRSPGFTWTAILSLALGIGANTVVFSVLNALVLKPLPVAEPERIYFVNNSGRPPNSFPNYRDIRDRNAVFESLFSYRIIQTALDNNNSTNRVWGYLVTGNYFATLGIKPALGRFITARGRRASQRQPLCSSELHGVAEPFRKRPWNCRKGHPDQRASVYGAGRRSTRVPRHGSVLLGGDLAAHDDAGADRKQPLAGKQKYV